MESGKFERFTTPKEEEDEKNYGLTLEDKYAYSLERSANKGEHIAEQNKHIAHQEEQHGEDPLTGARRREVLVHTLDQSLKRIHEGKEHRKEGISLIFIDLDKFKQVNDTHGHSEGDNVLKRVSELLKGLIRGTDMLARYGGDEFAVFLPDTSEKNAVSIAEKLRAALADDSEIRGFGVTASMGVCSSEVSTATDSGNFIKHADEAAYIAKRAGGNKVEVYT